MALPQADIQPTPEERHHLDAFLAELAPAVPTGYQLEPSWEPEFRAWILWVGGASNVPLGVYRRFTETSHALADKHGVEVTLAPVEAKHLD